MSTEILAALIGLIGVILGIIPTYLFMRQKSLAEIEKTKAETEKARAEAQKIRSEIILNEDSLQNLQGNIETVVLHYFVKIDDGVDYLNKKWLSAKRSIDHASLRKDFPRLNPNIQYERIIRDVITSNSIKVRYLANFSENRLKRTQELLSNPSINRYHVAFVDSDKLTLPMLNYMIFDGEELLLMIPTIEGEDVFIAIQNTKFASSFERYFNLLWTKAQFYKPVSENKTE